MNEKIYIYGINTISEVLNNKSDQLIEVLLDNNVSNNRILKLIDIIQKNSINLRRISKQEIEQITGTSKNQGIAAAIKRPKILDSKSALNFIKTIQNPLILILDGLQDPRNVGACMRTANASGVNLIVFPRSRKIKMTPIISKVSAGASALIKIAEIPNLVRFLKELKKIGLWICGTSEIAEIKYWEIDYSLPLAIILGSEDKGMRSLTVRHCDYLVSIPMIGEVESLNVSVAAGVVLYEALRQRSS